LEDAIRKAAALADLAGDKATADSLRANLKRQPSQVTTPPPSLKLVKR
jgi:hypothetical protein